MSDSIPTDSQPQSDTTNLQLTPPSSLPAQPLASPQPLTYTPYVPAPAYTSQTTTQSLSIGKIILFALMGIFAISLTAIAVFYFAYAKPRWALASAIANTLALDSYHVQLRAPLMNGMSLQIENDVHTDPTQLSKTETMISIPTDDAKTVTFANQTIVNNTDSYSKITHSQMKQMQTQLLTLYPNIGQDKSFAAIQPILHGEGWLHSQTNSEPTATEDVDARVTAVPFFIGIATGFTLNSYQPKLEVDGVIVQEYVFGLNKVAFVSLLEGFKDSSANINLADLNRIITAVQNSKHLSEDLLTIHVNAKQKLLKSITVKLPKELIEEIANTQQGQTSPAQSISELFSSPLAIINLLQENQDNTQLAIDYSLFNQIQPVTRPTQLVEENSLEKDGEILSFLFQYLSDPEMIKTATSQKNVFTTTTHETKLAFDKGEYTSGLSSAQSALTQAKSDEEKAIAHYWIGLHNHKLGKNSEATTNLLAAARLKKDYAAPYVTLGSISLAEGNYQKMLEYSQQCVTIDPKYAWCHNNLGIAFMSLNQPQKGIEELQQAVALDPLSFVFNDNLKRAKASLSN